MYAFKLVMSDKVETVPSTYKLRSKFTHIPEDNNF